MAEVFSDEAIILQVKAEQTADKYVQAFTRRHGKIRFIGYGARYQKSVSGRLLQPFSEMRVEVSQGSRIDRLRSAELVELPGQLNMLQMAYAAVATELVTLLTEDREPQEELYELLKQTLSLLQQRNPRIVVLAFAIKLLSLVGVAPQTETCVQCGRVLEQEEEAWFNALQGGNVCFSCHSKHPDSGYDHCGSGTRELWRSLLFLNMEQPESFTIKGAALMELEKMLFRFILFQTDKELKSLQFLAQLGAKTY